MIINSDEVGFASYCRYHKTSTFYDKNVYLLSVKNTPGVTLAETMLENYDVEQYIPQDILKSIRNKELILAIDMPYEALYSIIDRVYNSLIIRQQLPSSQILFIGSSKQLAEYNKEKAQQLQIEPIHYEFFSYWEKEESYRYKNNTNIEFPNTCKFTKKQKKFLCLNRQWRYHRLALLCLLYEKNLVDQSYYSFLNPYNLSRKDKAYGNITDEGMRKIYESTGVEFHPTLKIAKMQTVVAGHVYANTCPNNTLDDVWDITFKETLDNYPNIKDNLNKGYNVYKKLPLNLDDTSINLRHDKKDTLFAHAHTNNILLYPYYKNSLFSVVTNTHFDSKYPIWLEEKIFKPIFFKHPFILVGTYKNLEFLKSLGYKTFSNVIDETYDDIVNDGERLLYISNEIERLCNMNESQTNEFLQECHDIVKYNYKHFIEQN